MYCIYSVTEADISTDCIYVEKKNKKEIHRLHHPTKKTPCSLSKKVPWGAKNEKGNAMLCPELKGK